MSRPAARPIVLGLFVLACITTGIVAATQGWVQPESIQEAARDAGPWGLVAYVAAVVVLELLWMPRAWGLFAGGMLFGPLFGGLLSFVGDLCGALLCYVIARGFGKTWVEGLLERRPKSKKVVNLLAKRQGGPTMAFLRVMPVAHYTLVSYAAGIAGVRPRAYILGTAVGIIPGAVLYPTFGHSALSPTSPTFVVCASILVVVLVVTTFVARRKLKHRDSEQ